MRGQGKRREQDSFSVTLIFVATRAWRDESSVWQGFSLAKVVASGLMPDEESQKNGTA